MQWLRVTIVCAMLACWGSAVSADTVISTVPSWDGAQGYYYFGDGTEGPVSEAYGQTFIAPSASVLTGFDFYVGGVDAGAFRAHVMAWDGAKASGSILYDSDIRTFGNGTLSGPYDLYSFSTGGIMLTPGMEYVVFMSAIWDGVVSRSKVGAHVLASVYPDGRFVYANHTGDLSVLSTTDWNLGSTDLAFTLRFEDGVVIPTPGAAVGGLALLGIVGLRRRPA